MPLKKDADGRLTSRAVPGDDGATYNIMEAVVGPSGGGPSGQNKSMVSILNPASSGFKAKIRGLSVQAESSSGTNVIVLYELRRITAHSGGTTATIHKRDTTDAASALEAQTEPTSVTGDTNIQSYIIQSNTAQGPSSHFLQFGITGEKPICLDEGEGIVVHQVTSNGGTFQIGLIWTEEAIA